MDAKPHDFCASRWVKRLARSLASLKKAEEKYCSELSLNLTDGTELSFNSGSISRSSLYYRVKSLKDSTYYRSLSSCNLLFSALKTVERLLREHPVLNCALGTSDDNNEFRVFTPSMELPINLDQIKAGLMNCAMKSDFDDSASRLQEFLTPGKKHKFTGYYISVFQGLRLDDKRELSGGMSIAPFDKIKEFIIPSLLKKVVWDFDRFTKTRPLGVVLKPFQWKPLILPLNADLEDNTPWDEEFSDNAEIIVDLLAIAHSAPVTTIMFLGSRVDQRIWNILGVPNPGGSLRQHAGLSIMDYVVNTPLSMGKFSEVRNAFSQLKRQNNDLKRYKSIISRLSSSLLRRGKLRSEDKILDVAIALELMYELDSPPLRYKLGTRASRFLETNSDKRIEIFDKVRGFYDVRSSVVRNGKGNKKKKEVRGLYFRTI